MTKKFTSKKLILCLTLCATLGFPKVAAKTEVEADNLYFQGVATAEFIDSLTRGYRFAKMISHNEKEIRALALLNCATGLGVIATKILLGKFEGLLCTLPNILDLIRSIQVIKKAKKIAHKNRQKNRTKVDPKLLILLGLESSLSIAGKGIRGFGIGKDYEEYRKEMAPIEDAHYKKRAVLNKELYDAREEKEKLRKEKNKLWEPRQQLKNQKSEISDKKYKLFDEQEKIRKKTIDSTAAKRLKKQVSDAHYNFEWCKVYSFYNEDQKKEKLKKKAELKKIYENLQKQYDNSSYKKDYDRENGECEKKKKEYEEEIKKLEKQIEDSETKEKELKEQIDGGLYKNRRKNLKAENHRFEKKQSTIQEKFQNVLVLHYGSNVASWLSKAIWAIRFIEEGRYINKLTRPSLDLEMIDDENEKDSTYDFELEKVGIEQE